MSKLRTILVILTFIDHLLLNDNIGKTKQQIFPPKENLLGYVILFLIHMLVDTEPKLSTEHILDHDIPFHYII